jgi:hypothetical protein
LNTIPRQKLREIIAEHGIKVCDNPSLCKGLLADMCGQYKRENRLLVMALEEGIATDLLNSASRIPYEVTASRLVQRLYDNQGVDREFATWAVESWALALGIISAERLRPPAPERAPEPVKKPGAERRKAPEPIKKPEPVRDPAPGVNNGRQGAQRQQHVFADTNRAAFTEVDKSTAQTATVTTPRRRTHWGRALVIGIICYVIFNSLAHFSSFTVIAGFLLSLTIAFFAAAYGPWVGLALPAIGYFLYVLGVDHFLHEQFLFSPLFWQIELSIVALGFITGLSSPLTKRMSSALGATLIAVIFAGAGIIVEHLIYPRSYNFPLIAWTLVVLAILLSIWRAVIAANS